MTMAVKPMDEMQLTFANVDKQAGFRLNRLEVFNWGTFDGRVWTLRLNGENALVTGDIGSGKSSLVDAVTTLLVAPKRLAYNRAAGAESKERSVRSYVLGYYKSERSDSGYAAKPVSLRDNNHYSVILGHFHNQVLDSSVTLAQVFWMKAGQEQPDRFYVVATRDLSIGTDFSEFGSNLADLKRRLAAAGCTVKDSFKEYEATFLRHFGLKHSQPLDLFNQAVSLKSVGNLTDFVRTHMLEPFDIRSRIENLIKHFEDLSAAHAAVLKAKKQVELLEPILADGERLDSLSAQMNGWRAAQEALHPYIASRKVALLEQQLAALRQDAQDLAQRLGTFDQYLLEKRADEASLAREIEANGGGRLEQIDAEIDRKNVEKGRRRKQLDNYAALARVLDLPTPTVEDTFFGNRRNLNELQRMWTERQAAVEQQLGNLNGDRREEQRKLEPILVEIASLKTRRNNISGEQIELRRKLAAALDISEEEIPFVGELLQIRDDAHEWEGAVERLLHSFGLSLLVPDGLYERVSAWVDQTHLAGRLVYFRVRDGSSANRASMKPQTVPTKLRIKPDSQYYDWLENELAVRFNVVCCETMEEFRREPFAVTRAGQMKGARDRHEKDDRYRLTDRSRYVLGWDNAGKIKALEQERNHIQLELNRIDAKIRECKKDVEQASEHQAAIRDLGRYADFSEIDWGSIAREIDSLQQEREQLESGSNILRTLRDRLEALHQEIEKADKERAAVHQKQGANLGQQEAAGRELARAQEALQTVNPEARGERFAVLATLQAEAFAEPASVEACTDLEEAMGRWLRSRLERAGTKAATLRNDIVRAMVHYRTAFPTDTQDVDAAVEALDEYRAAMARIRADDLPRFEAKFKKLLNENTIRGIVQFQAQLGKQRKIMEDRIQQINHSLKGLDYNTGRYIRLDADPSPDREIREFQLQLRACTEDTLTASAGDQYSEAKFLQVKEIVERFRGRDGFSEVDRRWTEKVTDVRNEFVFSASERWREGDKEHEHYTDSGGKSGGQKEKLAYTILAASLAYQFGLDSGSARSFRFVVIDEAFGRGSDESAQFGLALFQHLGLQLLVVTPLQKIHVIEPYVANVGFVYNEEGRQSQLRNITIAEYRAEREARRS